MNHFLDASGAIFKFPAADNNSALFIFKQKITVKTVACDTKNVEVMVPLKYLSDFWRDLEMPLINCHINLVLTWYSNCVFTNDAKAATFAITDTKVYVTVAMSSTQDNVKLSQQFKSCFKRTITWNKYQSKSNNTIVKPIFRLLN